MASARNRHMRSALLLGLAAGMRTFSAPAALALRGGPLNGPRRVLLLAAVGEMVADKLPATPSRLERGGIIGRLLSGAIVGHRAGGAGGAATGACAALAGAFAGHSVRTRFTGPLAAVCEDGLAISLATLGAARSSRRTSGASQLTS